MGWVGWVILLGLAPWLTGSVLMLLSAHRRGGPMRLPLTAAKWGYIAALPVFLTVAVPLAGTDGQGGFVMVLLIPALGFGWLLGLLIGLLISGVRRAHA